MPESNMPPSLASQWFRRLSHVVSQLRLQPFEQATEAGRAQERHRRILLTALAAAASKAMGALTALISVPLTIRYLDKERFGLWMTVTTFMAMLSFADLGIGNGLLNWISEANGKDDRSLAQRGVSSCFYMLAGIGAALLLVFFAMYGRIDWPSLLKLTSPKAVAEAGPVTAVLAVCFALNLPLGIVNRIQLGYQQGFVNSLWTGAGNLLALAGVLTAVYFRAGLPWLVGAIAGAPLLALLLNGIVLFSVQRPWLIPRWHYASAHTIKLLMRAGTMFFILSIAFQLTYTPDNFIVLHFSDEKSVADYSVVAKVFSLAPLILEMLLTPLWPAYGEAATRGDVAWIKKTLGRSIKGGLLLAGMLTVVLILFGRPLIALYTGNLTHPAFSLLLGFGCCSLLWVWGIAASMFLNGVSALKFKAVCAVVLAVVAVPAKLVLGARFGLPGIIWAMVISYVVCTVVPISLHIPRLLTEIGASSRRPPNAEANSVAPGAPADLPGA
jgi:O-antigen/teichoic acid export membrane protein